MVRRLAGFAALALLGGCVGEVAPPRSPAPARTAAKPAAALASAAAEPASYPPRLAGAGRIVPAVPLVAAPALAATANSNAAGLSAGPAVAALPIDEDEARAARSAFAASCPGLQRRTDTSGLTTGADWQSACVAASMGGEARAFFATYFEAVQVGDGQAFATGYYEPEIAASRQPGTGFATPIYARPSDLIDVDLGQFAPALKGKKVRGRVQGSALVPYYDRTAIESGAIDGKARVIAWAADPVALFFLQIQGSGRLRLPNGSIQRVGYDTQNGRDYTGIGSLMRTRGLLGPGQASMQGIVAWLHDHPVEGTALMRENRSYVFFREIAGAPLGAMGYPVSGQVSAAVDPAYVPLGAPVFLSMDRGDASGLWVAQDTGGAIKGANRIDTFWGAGAAAATIAGGMSAHGTAWLLLPVGTLARRAAAEVPVAPTQP